MEAACYQNEIDDKNKNFWNELCGTSLAKSLGIKGNDEASLAKFDDFYFSYYPYLKKHLFLDEITRKNILEVGLGYGTVSQLLASAGANYYGLDIAENACKIVSHRLAQKNLHGEIRNESMLSCSFPDNFFDHVISIGCFHHTGNLQECINQTYRVLKPGGKAAIMVYNKFSLRQWMSWPVLTTKNLLSNLPGINNGIRATEAQRKAYDASSNDTAAPETEFFSMSELQRIFRKFKNVKIERENFDENVTIKLGSLSIYRFGSRLTMLDSFWTKKFGLDLYLQAEK